MEKTAKSFPEILIIDYGKVLAVFYKNGFFPQKFSRDTNYITPENF